MSDERYTSGRSWAMAGSERREDGAGGALGTMARPGARPRPGRAPEAGQGGQGGSGGLEQRRGRQPRPVPPQRPAAASQAVPVREQGTGRPAAGQRTQRAGQQPGTGRFAGVRPRPAGDAPWRVPPARRDQEPQAEPTQAAQSPRPAAAAAAGPHRMPFVLLLCGLLGGALISALVISTTLAEGSFRISRLQDSTSTLARQRQALQDAVAQAQSALVIEQQAAKLGMRRTSELQFVNLKSGKTTSDGTPWSGAASAPGYAP